MTENFLPIPNFPNYEINSAFVVRNRETKRICKSYVHSNGYVTVVVRRSDGKWSSRSVRSLRSQAQAAQNSAEYVQLSEFPSYEISANGVVRNRRTKRPLKKCKGNMVQLLLSCKKKTTYRSVNSLLWEAFGIIKGNPSKFLPVMLQHNGRQIHFDTKTQAAQFLAEKYFYSVETIQNRLSRQLPEICGWQVTYLTVNDDKIHLPAMEKINKLARRHKKIYGADIQPAAERRADHVRNSTATVST